MLTLRTAAALLEDARDLDALARLGAELGFAPPLPLDADAHASLGLDTLAHRAGVARAAGNRRALVAELDGSLPLRDAVRRIAGRMAQRAPHRDWLLLATERDGRGVALAGWSADRSPPRVAALVVDRGRVVDSDAETVRRLAASATAPDAATHLRTLDVLGREALTERFYRALEARVGALAAASTGSRATPDERRELALLCVSRLLFLSFLEAKGWLDGDPAFLVRGFERAAGLGRRTYHDAVLLPLFFGTLNTPVRRRAPAARAFGRIPFLNGGLFSPTPLERRHRALRFPDAALGAVYSELLCRYRFTAREDGAGWSEAAIDPEMLGRSFESLMASRERQRTGAFYTPQPLVERLTTQALAHALAAPRAGRALSPECVDAALRGEAVAPARRARLLEAVDALRLLDPACGSGAFLVHALERVAELRGRLGDDQPVDVRRRETLTRTIFGVDCNPAAVWLCELRLWLSVVIEREEADPLCVPALPNLDRNVRVGDALSGGAFERGASDAVAGRRVAALRDRYARATGARKAALHARLDRVERACAVAALDAEIARLVHARRECLLLARARDLFGMRVAPADAPRRARELRAGVRAARLARQRLADGGPLPFAFGAHFADVAADAGFDLVIGNPPWVRPHHVAAAARLAARRDFRVAREAAWQPGAGAARAGRGFAAQVDLAALFVERSVSLLRRDGVAALLLPAKLWRSLAGGGVRALLAREARLLALEDWSDAPALFDAAVYPSSIVVRRRAQPRPPDESDHDAVPGPPAEIVVHAAAGERRWRASPADLPLHESAGSPWLLLPDAERRAFERLARAGAPLGEGPLGPPLLGVKCGANDAFTLEVRRLAGDVALVRQGRGAAAREGRVERALVRPLLRGQEVRPWHASPGGALLWTHDADGEPLAELPPLAAAWLAPWRRRLVARADARRRRRWWSLFRVDGAAHDCPRVVWADIGRAVRAAVLHAGDDTVPLNSCYVVRCPTLPDAWALAALLNAPLASAWLGALAEPARGAYRRFLGWTLALLPLPRDWPRAVRLLAPLGERGTDGAPPSPDRLLAAALDAYAVTREQLAPLLEWSAR